VQPCVYESFSTQEYCQGRQRKDREEKEKAGQILDHFEVKTDSWTKLVNGAFSASSLCAMTPNCGSADRDWHKVSGLISGSCLSVIDFILHFQIRNVGTRLRIEMRILLVPSGKVFILDSSEFREHLLNERLCAEYVFHHVSVLLSLGHLRNV
jgi:hypothetical protein